jgi:ABC-type dipeptide/oligopeptide/nickel transport system ATPase component
MKFLNTVGIKEVSRVANSYPHQLSGGLKQRVLIAIAMACKPQLIITDEISTSLDYINKINILYLIR